MKPVPRILANRWAWSAMGLLLALGLASGKTWALASGGPRVPTSVGAAQPLDEDDRAAITFAGFHVFADGTSRIWVKLSREVPVERDKPGTKRLVYTLQDSRVLLKNNKNPLITEYFSSPVSQARLVSKKRHTELVISLREDITPQHRVVSRSDGTVSFQVDFPARQGAGAPSEPPAEVPGSDSQQQQ